MPAFVSNKKEINYNSYGEGPAVLLIHGFGEDSRVWEAQVDALKNDYQLIVPDLAGSGKSEVSDAAKSSIEDHAESMVSLLDELKIDKAVLLGHSMGGYIGLAFAEKYPARLNALGLVHSGAYADDAEKIKTRRQAINVMKEKGAAAFLKTAIPGLFADPEKCKAAIEKLLKQGTAFTAEALSGYYEAMIARPDRTDVLKDAKMPVLFIAGVHDKAVPFQHSLEQSHLPDLSEIVVMQDSAHMSMIEETEKLNTALKEFLTRATAQTN